MTSFHLGTRSVLMFLCSMVPLAMRTFMALARSLLERPASLDAEGGQPIGVLLTLAEDYKLDVGISPVRPAVRDPQVALTQYPVADLGRVHTSPFGTLLYQAIKFRQL
jgi:hypothetical protein